MKFKHLLFALAVLLFSGGSLQAQFPCFNGITLLGPGPDPIDLCEDGQSGQIVFTTNIVALPIGYIVLDENDVIVYIGTNGRIDFGGLPGNNFRVYGFNFIGQITAQVGDVLGTPLTNGCFALTANFITVTGDALAGGTISTDDGLDEVYTCPGDSLPDVVRFINDGTDPGASFVYIITDEDNIITHILPGDSFDFEDLGEGVSRVWGLSYQGNLLAMVGDDAAGAILAEGCYALTNNFVTVIRSSPDGGTVAAEGGSQDIFYCPGSGDPNVRIDSMGASNSPYLFVLTDTSNVILALDTAGVFNLDSFPSGIYRAWGLAYTGLITAQVGDTASVTSLSDGCFALSSNFVLINTEGPNGGTLSTDAGEIEVFTCPSDGIADTIRFISVGAVGDFFQFIITDTNNIILTLPDLNEVDFGAFNEGVYRVWGLGYTGNLLAMVGDTASAVPLADECFGLSLNFVTVFNIDPVGGTVSTATGESSAFGCPNDSIPDIFSFDHQNAAGSNYAYVITDNDNNVLVVIDGDSADFDTLGTGQFRVWGVSFTGNLTVMAGDDFSAADLSDGCFARSENFVTVFMEQPAGGTVSTTDGLTEVFVCPGTGQSNQLSFASADASNSLYAYVVTDTNNVILELLAGNTADFDSLPSADGYRVWGLAYTGNVTAQPGDTASAVSLTDGCFDLSANFVSISLDGAAGGTASTEDGLTEVAFCANDSLSSLLRFDSAGVSGSGFVYLVTDTSNIILNILAVDSFDFFGATSGIFRVWGLGFTGDLQAEVGDDAAATTLSDGCFSLSSNFITVTRDAVTGGEVSTDDGLVELTLCSGDGIPDTVRFESMGAEGPFYAFVLTDTNNVILGLADDGAIDFEGLGDGVFRVWGLAFSGNLTAMVGDTASAVSLTDGCFDLSSNFVTVFNKETIGGTVSTESGDNDALLCPGDAVVSFDSSGTSGEFYAYVVTDTNNVILALLNGDSFDFDSLAVDPVRVWGLAYSGNLLAAAGDTASAIALTDECFSLSENFVTVRKEDVAGGTVSTDDGAVEVFVCPGNGIPDVVVFESAGASGAGFVFVITDENNLIIALPPDNTFDFEDSGQGVSRIWGLAYNGNLLAQIGDDAASALLADGCYALSGNFITVYHEQPVGGTVSSATGEDEVFLCPSGTGGLVEFANAGASNSLYAYLVTDLDNIVLDIATGNTADFTALGDGIYRVWGVAYTGGLTVMPGEDAAATDLSDDCFDLSSNFVTVFVEEPEGGTVSTLGGQDTVSFCVSDNEPDIVDMTTTGGGNSQYAYLVTDTNNVVQLVSTSSAVDLEGTGDGLSRIWGLAYTGNITVMAGDTATAVALSDECFSLSSNFVLVIKEALTGGTVLTDAGEEVVYTCPDDGLPDTVRFASTGLIGDSFTYLVTDTNNVILAILDEDFEDFEDYGIGVRRVWGLAYNGNLTAAVGDTASVVRLADQCFGLSANFVTVFSDIPHAGTLSTADGADEISACAVADLASLISFDSMGVVNSLFAYVVTDTNNIVLFTPSLDLSGIVLIESGLVRVWGMAYTGNITAMPGDTASIVALSDECYDLSDNFILVTLEPVAGGQVFTTDFETELFTCPDDGNPDVFFFLNFDIIGANATLAITDTNNVLINYNAFTDPTDFENLPSMIYRIWSIAYSGDLLAEPGDTLDRIEIASGCFALSENFVTVNNDVPNGGRISTTDGDTVVTVIVGDGLTDFLTFESEGASNSRYVYVLTDTSNVIEEILVGDTYNFENSGLEPQRVWGLAYTGTLTAMVGDTASLVDLSDDCYSLTENFVLVLKLPPSAPELSPDELTGVQIDLWPVPASQSLTVSVREVVGTTDRSPAQLLLLNQAGVLLSAYRTEAREGAQQFELDIEALPPGLYFLQYRSATEVKTERFIKQ